MKAFATRPKTRRQAAEQVADDSNWEQVCVCVAFISQQGLIAAWNDDSVSGKNYYKITDVGRSFVSTLERILFQTKQEVGLLERCNQSSEQ